MTFLDAPEARQVVDEVIIQDCYRIDEIPPRSLVIDVGAFYGEFGILSAKKKQSIVFAYEPSEVNFHILCENLERNVLDDQFETFNAGVTDRTGREQFYHWHEHPGGSGFRQIEGGGATIIETVSMIEVISKALAFDSDSHITVKLDCEGSEKEIFKDEHWIRWVGIVTMEWHNYDGHVYADILSRHGFDVELNGGGPKPRAAYDKSMGGGLLFAKRKT